GLPRHLAGNAAADGGGRQRHHTAAATGQQRRLWQCARRDDGAVRTARAGAPRGRAVAQDLRPRRRDRSGLRCDRRDGLAAGRSVSDADEVSAYDRLVWPEGKLEQWLATGAHRRELLAYFGEAEYARLHTMALAAAAVPQDPERVVWFVPGIMG